MFAYEHDKLKHYSYSAHPSPNPSRAHGPAYGLWKFQIVGKDGRQSFKSFGSIDVNADGTQPNDYWNVYKSAEALGLIHGLPGGWSSADQYDDASYVSGRAIYRNKFTFDITNDAEGVYTHLHNTAYTPTSVVYYVKVEFIGARFGPNAPDLPPMEWAYRDLDFDVNNLPELSPQPSNNFLYDFYDQTWYNANKHEIPHVLPRWNLSENDQYQVNQDDGKRILNPNSGWDFQAANESADVASNHRFNGGCWLLPGGTERYAGISVTEPHVVTYGGYYLRRSYARPPKAHYVPQFNVWIEK
jgi:hypothetical protein